MKFSAALKHTSILLLLPNIYLLQVLHISLVHETKCDLFQLSYLHWQDHNTISWSQKHDCINNNFLLCFSMNKTSPQKRPVIPCENCDMTFNTTNELELHMNYEHSYKCSRCNARVASREQLTKHFHDKHKVNFT